MKTNSNHSHFFVQAHSLDQSQTFKKAVHDFYPSQHKDISTREDWSFKCHCQPQQPIPMMVCRSKNGNFFLRNYKGSTALHHPDCPFYDLQAIEANTWKPDENQSLIMAIDGFQKPQRGHSRHSSNKSSQKNGGPTKTTLNQFATQWLANSLSYAVNTRLMRQETTPSWNSLFFYQEKLLKQMVNAHQLNGTLVYLKDFYLPIPQYRYFKELSAELMVRYGADAKHYPFLVFGRVLSFEQISNSHYLIKLQPNVKGDVSYLILDKSNLDRILRYNSLLTIENPLPKDRIIWLTAFISQTDKPVTHRISTQSKTFSLQIPVCQSFALTPLSLNGMIVKHFEQLNCLNEAYQSGYFIKPVDSKDLQQLNLSSTHDLSFYFLDPSQKGKKRYCLAHISIPKYDQPNYLEELVQWHWDLKKDPEHPPFPFSKN